MSRDGTGDPLRRAARRRPEAPAADGPGGRWSYRRLDREASLLAGRVRERLGADGTGGREAPSRVAALLPRRPAALAAVHGVPRAGAVLAPVQRRWTDRELAGYLEEVDPELLLAPPEGRERAAGVAPGVPRAPLARGEGAGTAPGAGTEADAGSRAGGPPPVDGDRDHSLVATSGSTGAPRPVRLTWGNHLASAAGARERLDLAADDRWYASLSLAHVGGLAVAVRAAVVGSSVVLRGEFDAAELSRLADEGGVTHASLVPVMLRRVLEARGGRPLPESFGCALVGGAAPPPDLLERALEEGVPVALTYGLTEACSQVATAPPDLVRRKPGTAGLPLPGVEVRAAGSDRGGDAGGEADRGGPDPGGAGAGGGEEARAEGEILVRGPTVSPGYLDGGTVAADGWLRTGDVGRIDGEGHLWITGRLSERIVTGGTTVHPAEVEAVVGEHPGVREAAVLGTEDEEWGELVTAAVVREPDGPGRAELEEHCRERLSSPKRPRRWLLLETMPRLAGGKPDRAEIRRRLDDA